MATSHAANGSSGSRTQALKAGATKVLRSGAKSPSGQDRDWADQLTHHIESGVGLVKDKTTTPATTVAKGIVFGIVIGILGATILALLILVVVRIGNVYLPFHPHSRRVWVTYAIAAAIFLLLGAFAWRKRRPKRA